MIKEEHSKDTLALVESIRKVILTASSEISEQVKWNSPSFFFNGEMKPFNPKEYKRDIVVLNIRPERILLVFPTGAIVEDIDGILEGNYVDGRRMITIRNLKDLEVKSNGIQFVLQDWLKKVER